MDDSPDDSLRESCTNAERSTCALFAAFILFLPKGYLLPDYRNVSRKREKQACASRTMFPKWC